MCHRQVNGVRGAEEPDFLVAARGEPDERFTAALREGEEQAAGREQAAEPEDTVRGAAG